ncbi:MAG: UDP-N-acetylmuramate dehydrogenase, partial [Rhodospirillales bacterium]
MMPARSLHSLLDRLPDVRGRYEENAALAKYTWFRVGGPADVLFHPADEADLSAFLAARPKDVPVSVLGVGSNVLVRDGGLRGVVIRLGRAFAEIAVDGMEITAGAGASDVSVAAAARDANIAGLEFLRGIPGTVGGALRMNAGAYGVEMKDVTAAARALDADGVAHDLDSAALGFTYRRCAVAEDWIFVAAVLKGRPGKRADIAERMAGIQAEREETQPLRTPTGGSTFKNPNGEKAWELIDRAGCRGLRRGGAMVSDKHCNFLINTGGASAADLEGLGEEVRRRVFETSGVTLEWEIR